MALGEFTKQLAQQALLNATSKEPAAPAQPANDNVGATIIAQIAAMQKKLKEDEELAILFHKGGEKVRVMEIYMPSWRVAVLSGVDQDRGFARVVSPAESLQLIIKVVKSQPGAKPVRINLVTPKG